MERRRMLALAFGLPLSWTAAAAEIHQCVDAAGRVIYQDRSCAQGQRTASTRTADDGTASPAARAQARAEQRRIDEWARQSRGRLPPSLGGRERPAPGSARSHAAGGRAVPDPCATARAAREDAYRRDGNRMDFDRRRQLQDAVNAACGLR